MLNSSCESSAGRQFMSDIKSLWFLSSCECKKVSAAIKDMKEEYSKALCKTATQK